MLNESTAACDPAGVRSQILPRVIPRSTGKVDSPSRSRAASARNVAREFYGFPSGFQSWMSVIGVAALSRGA
jgi:hypothetical protein